MKKSNLKFRVWIPGLEQMFITQSFKSLAEYADLENAEVMHTTGLFDINKKEIFEDDIVKASGDTTYSKNLVGLVTITPNGVLIKNLTSNHTFEVFRHTFEVIGNLYENPEYKQ